MTLYAAVRHEQLDFATLRDREEKHGRRLGYTDKILPVEYSCYAATFDGETGKLKGGKVRQKDAAKSDRLAIVGAYKAFKKYHNAREQPQTKKHFLQVVAYVSPGACDGHGGTITAEKIYQQAVDWAKKRYGNKALFAVRCDLDEPGSPAVVDLYLAPVEMLRPAGRHKSGGEAKEPVPTISVRSAHKRIAEKDGIDLRKIWSQNQDSWTAHMRKATGVDLKRGKPKKETNREHMHHSAYKAQQEQQKEVERLTMQAQIDELREQVKDLQEENQQQGRYIARIRRQIAEWRELVQAIRSSCLGGVPTQDR